MSETIDDEGRREAAETTPVPDDPFDGWPAAETAAGIE